MQTKKTRIRWIDNARGICVFCVLLAHCKLEHTYLQMIAEFNLQMQQNSD